MTQTENNLNLSYLPEYVVADPKSNVAPVVLRTIAEQVSFPLSQSDLEYLAILIQKFDHEQHCVGLAAPQIGIAKRIIIFAVPDDPELKLRRPDLTDSMPKTIWINPEYTPLGDETHEDYEGCFSVPNIIGLVKRYKSISYSAYDINGSAIAGTANGFLARVMQHEIDHLNGKLFTDYLPSLDSALTVEEYRALRAYNKNNSDHDLNN
jgi:peptide deformylase